MNKEHAISDEALKYIESRLLRGNHYLAYNTASYFLDHGDVYLFNQKDEALEFATYNISEYDSFKVITIESIEDLFKQIPYGLELLKLLSKVSDQTILSTQKNIPMNEKNLDYLKAQIKFTGFGDELANDLKEKLQQRSREFQLCYDTRFGNDIVVATLNFKKSEHSDMYFFNSYDMMLKKDNSRDLMKQSFYINKANNITLKEAYNLMDGRAVNKDFTNKEGQVYNAWVQLEFKEVDKNNNFQVKQYHSNYGFNLEKELSKYPIKELNVEQDKSRLMESLQKGNRQSITYLKEGTEQKAFIEANPKFKTINVFDSNLQRVNIQSQKEKSAPEQSVKQEAKKESQNDSMDDGGDMPKSTQKRSKKKGQSIN